MKWVWTGAAFLATMAGTVVAFPRGVTATSSTPDRVGQVVKIAAPPVVAFLVYRAVK